MSYNPEPQGASKGIFVLGSLVASLIKFLVGIIVILLIMIYVFDLGAWRLAGVQVASICSMALKAAVIIALIHTLVLKPIALLVRRSAILESLKDDMAYPSNGDTRQANFMARYFNANTWCYVASSIAAAVIAFLAHDPMMGAIGNPIADLLTLAIIGLVPVVLGYILFASATSGLKKEDPQLYSLCLGE